MLKVKMMLGPSRRPFKALCRVPPWLFINAVSAYTLMMLASTASNGSQMDYSAQLLIFFVQSFHP
jgi:hypothetical protein